MNPAQETKNKTAWLKIIKLLFELLFPSLIVWQIQRRINKASWVNDPWFRAQKRLSLKAALILLIPSMISIAGSALALNFDPRVSVERYQKSFFYLKKGQVKKAKDSLSVRIDEGALKSSAEKLAVCLLPTLFISLYILSTNTLLKKQRLLEKTLNHHRFWGEDKPGLAVYTPVGILVDLGGRHNPKDLVLNKTIWIALNLAIDEKDWLEKPEKRSIVFFKHAFQLKEAYIFDLNGKI